MSSFPYETLRVLTVPEKTSSPQQVVDLYDKLDWLSTKLDSEYPVGDVNYNDGLPKHSHAFHKGSKFIGRKLDPFEYRSTLRDEHWKTILLKNIAEKVGNDRKFVRGVTRKMGILLDRSKTGELEAKEFLNDPEIQAFFNGNHNDLPGQVKNIFRNLNMNLTNAKTLEISKMFETVTPSMLEQNGELHLMKIFGNGERLMAVIKEDIGKNYSFTGEGEMELEIGWIATDDNEEEKECIAIVGMSGGKSTLQKMTINGEECSVPETMSKMAEQNARVLLRGKSLQQLVDRVAIKQVKEAAMEIAKLMSPKVEVAKEDRCKSEEVVTVRDIPMEPKYTEEDVLDDVKKVSFSKGPFSPDDKINYNDGQEADAFDKLAKDQGRNKDVHLFNSMLENAEQREKIMEIVEENCQGNAEPASYLKERFETREKIYRERVSQGTSNAKKVLGNEVGAFFYGPFVDTADQPRNIYQNLNMKVQNGQVLQTSKLVGMKFDGSEPGKVQRLKVSGNGYRLLNTLRNDRGPREYEFSKRANMDLKVMWTGEDTNHGNKLESVLIFDIEQGKIRYKVGSLNGENIEPEVMLQLAIMNNQVRLKKKSLTDVLADILKSEVPLAPGFDCGSAESLTILPKSTLDWSLGFSKERSSYGEFYETLNRLQYAGPIRIKDELNCNFESPASHFNKLRKFCGRHLDICVFTALLQDETEKRKILDIVKQNCNNDPSIISQFEEDIQVFLDRIRQGREDVFKYIGIPPDELNAFFTGYHFQEEFHERNPHANLIIALDDGAKTFETSSYFDGRYGEEKDELKRIKFFTTNGRVVTAAKLGTGERNYIVHKDCEVQLDIKWKAIKGETTSNCFILLKIENGVVDVAKSEVDGISVPVPAMVGLARQNNKVLVRNKTLLDIIISAMKKDRRRQKMKASRQADDQLRSSNPVESADEEKFVIIQDADIDANKL